MRRQQTTLFLVILFLGLSLANTSWAQLLEDRNKLKTERRARKPFVQFKKNVKKPQKTNKKPDVVAAWPVPFTKDKAGDQGGHEVKPKYSKTKTFSTNERVFQPRYTKDNAGKYKIKPFSPRYTRENAGKYKFRPFTPRYTQENAGTFKGRIFAPRYTQENAGEFKGKVFAPRYTRENAGEYHGKPVRPRFTQNVAGRYKPVRVIPRFTQETAGQGYEKWRANPRFTIRDPKDFRVVKVQPRFSTPPDYVDYPVSGRKRGFLPSFQLTKQKARYPQGEESNAMGPKVPVVYKKPNSMAKYNKTISSYQKHISKGGKKSPYASQTEFFGPKVKRVYVPSHSMAKYNKSLASYQKYISRSNKKSPYAEQTEYVAKMKKMKKHKDAHPSANYLSAKYDGNPLVRKTKREVSVTWVRIFGNKTQPKGVKGKVKPSKFDKDEKDIWNNVEREYTR